MRYCTAAVLLGAGASALLLGLMACDQFDPVSRAVVVVVIGLAAWFLVRNHLGRLTELRRLSQNLWQRKLDLEASQAELRQVQVGLQASESRYRTMIEWSPESILVHRQGIVLYVNPAAVKMFGVPDAHALLGKQTEALIHPDCR